MMSMMFEKEVFLIDDDDYDDDIDDDDDDDDYPLLHRSVNID